MATEVVNDQLIDDGVPVAVIQESPTWGLLLIRQDGTIVAQLEEPSDAIAAWRTIQRAPLRIQISIDLERFLEAGGKIIEIPFGMSGTQWKVHQDVAGLDDLIAKLKEAKA